MKRVLLITLFALVIGSSVAQAQGSGQVVGTQCWINGKLVGGFPAGYKCPGTSGGSTGSSPGVNPNLYNGFYQLGYQFGQWLFGSGSNPQAELQKQQMMAELQRRQAEAERQHREEEASRVAGMYNRLVASLKLSGLPNLQLKEIASNSPVLKLKLGDSADGQAGIKGLPGIYLNEGNAPYGIPGLPGIYTGGPGQGSGLTNSGLALKIGESSTEAAQAANVVPVPAGQNESGRPSGATNGPARALANESGLQLKSGDSDALSAAQANMLDPGKMTPQQLADVAELVSRLPPEDQQRLLTAAQHGAAAGQPVPSPTGQPSAQALTPLKQQADASQAAAAAPVLEDASAKARAGFDQPLGPAPVQLGSTSATPSILRHLDPNKPITVDQSVLQGGGQDRQKQSGTRIMDCEQDEFDKMNAAWLRKQQELIRQAVEQDKKWTDEVLASIKEIRVPGPIFRPKKLNDLHPGDILLIAPDDSLISQGIIRADPFYRAIDYFSGGDVSDPKLKKGLVSHAMTFVKTVNGEMLFLDHTGVGSRILNTEEFIKKYGSREMYIARPQAKVDGRELWEAAREAALKKKSDYGVLGDNVVCSKRAAIAVAKATELPLQEEHHILGNFLPGIDITPSDFFDDKHVGKYFLISALPILPSK